jgi:hypothetical protein
LVRAQGFPRGIGVARILFAVVVGLDLGTALHVLSHPQAAVAEAMGDRDLLGAAPVVTRLGTNIALTDSLRPINRTVRVVAKDLHMTLDRTPLTCHGGRARITWHVGNLEPTVPMTGIALSVRLDGKVIGSLLRGSADGTYNDNPASIMAVADCPAGEHVLDVVISEIDGGWGIPYVANVGERADHLLMNRGFIVMEVW